MDFSIEAIQQLSPDEASLKAARGLVNPAKWPLLGVNDRAFWGECQGSGSRPYQVQVDKSGPAFKCSCPSRKFPCKHGLALLLLHVQKSERFTSGELPAWVNDWLASRQEKAEKKTRVEASPVDPAAKAKREMLRRQRMLAGLQELELWLKDQIRHGLARLGSDSNSSQALAARMIDAQLPSMARRVAAWPSIISRNNSWPEVLLAEFGEMQLLIDGFRRIELLPEPMQADLQTALGWVVDKEAVIADGEKICDDWLVLGQRIYEEDRLWARRVWLRAKITGRLALLLDFSHGNRQFENVFLTGSYATMTLAFYPGNAGLRALLTDNPEIKKLDVTDQWLPAEEDIVTHLPLLAARVAANPWQKPQPLLVSNALMHYNGKCVQLTGENGEMFSLQVSVESGWHLLAESGGKLLHVFGEWSGTQLVPLSAWNPCLVWSNTD